MRRLLLAFCLLLVGTPALAGWKEARTRHFILYSEQPEAELRQYAERLERFDHAVRKVRAMADPVLTDGGRLTVYVLGRASDVEALVPRAAGFYLSRDGRSFAVVSSEQEASAGGRESPQEIFFHEYAHHLMLGDMKVAMPPWLIEGSAEFYSTAIVDPDGAVRFGAPPQRHATVLLRDLGFSVRHLIENARLERVSDRASIYAKGWLLTHYLTFTQERSGQLTRYLEALGQGTEPLAAGEQAFGNLRALDGMLDAYARSRTFQLARVEPGLRPEVAIRPLRAGEAAMLRTRLLVDRAGSRISRQSVAAEARRIAGDHGDDAAVLATLARAELWAGNHEAAIAAATRALALEPANVAALLAKGQAMMAAARAPGATADWPAIRRLFIRANRADTENAEPLWAFYRSFAAAGQEPGADAVQGLFYAHALAPQSRGIRFAAVRELLKRGDLAGARKAFGPIVYDPHMNLTRRPLLGVAMQRIAAGDAPGALAAIEADYRGERELDEAA